METSITCPLIFHSHTGAVNLRCNRYTDTQASCVITRGTMSAQLPVPLHSSGFQLTWADPHANHTWLLSTRRMKKIMLLGWCSSQQEGLPPSRTAADRDKCCSHLSHPVWSARGQQGLRASEDPPRFLLPSEYLWLEQWCWGLLRDVSNLVMFMWCGQTKPICSQAEWLSLLVS